MSCQSKIKRCYELIDALNHELAIAYASKNYKRFDVIYNRIKVVNKYKVYCNTIAFFNKAIQ